MLDTHSLYKNLVQAGLTKKISEVLSDAILQNSNTEKVENLKQEQFDIKTNISLMQNDIANIKANMVTKAEFSKEIGELKALKWILPVVLSLNLAIFGAVIGILLR
jgi:hypothetical protein